MGFSEFKRLSKRFSSQVFGVAVHDDDEDDDEDDDDYSVTERGPSNSDLYSTETETFLRARAAERAKRRWHDAYRKVVALNRFSKLVGHKSREREWIETRARQTLFTAVGAAAATPLEILETRAITSQVPLIASPWTRAIIAQAVPLCIAGALAAKITLPQTQWEQRARRQKPTLVASLALGAASAVRQGLRLLVLYPFKVAFSRLVVHGLGAGATLGTLSPRIYNGFAAFWAVETASKGVAALMERITVDKAGFALGLTSAIVSYGVVFPTLVMREQIFTSAPESLFPAQLSAGAEVAEIFANEGLRGFFRGWETMLWAGPLELAALILSRTLTGMLIGRSRRERFQIQVEQVREALELKQGPIWIEDISHLEALLLMATRHNRVVFILMVNVSEESKFAVHDCTVLAESVDATFVIADARKIESLRRIAYSSRFPCLIPVADGTLETNSIVNYRYGHTREIEQRLREIVADATHKAMHGFSPQQSLRREPQSDNPHAGSSEML